MTGTSHAITMRLTSGIRLANGEPIFAAFYGGGRDSGFEHSSVYHSLAGAGGGAAGGVHWRFISPADDSAALVTDTKVLASCFIFLVACAIFITCRIF